MSVENIVACIPRTNDEGNRYSDIAINRAIGISCDRMQYDY